MRVDISARTSASTCHGRFFTTCSFRYYHYWVCRSFSVCLAKVVVYDPVVSAFPHSSFCLLSYPALPAAGTKSAAASPAQPCLSLDVPEFYLQGSSYRVVPRPEHHHVKYAPTQSLSRATIHSALNTPTVPSTNTPSPPFLSQQPRVLKDKRLGVMHSSSMTGLGTFDTVATETSVPIYNRQSER